MGKAVRLSDIGSRLGVSTVTVSKALSGQKGVSEELRAKIIALSVEMGYRKEISKDNGSQTDRHTIGVVISEKYIGKYDSFYLKMFQTINAVSAEEGNLAVLATLADSEEAEGMVPKILCENRPEGLMIVGRLSKEYLKALHQTIPVPWVFVDFYDEEEMADAVISDSYYGAYQLTRYLLKRGHRCIAYVGTLLSTSSITDRYMGYARAMLEYGITPKKEWQIEDRDVKTGRVDEQNLLKLPKELPTAFFCNCDVVASALIKKLNAEGIRVPQEVSVVGYDNFLYPGLCDIGITTYEVDLRKMAEQALTVLLQKMKTPGGQNRLYIVEGHVVEKESVEEFANTTANRG